MPKLAFALFARVCDDVFVLFGKSCVVCTKFNLKIIVDSVVMVVATPRRTEVAEDSSVP